MEIKDVIGNSKQLESDRTKVKCFDVFMQKFKSRLSG